MERKVDNSMKTVCWDIECTDLDAHWARILTVATKSLGGPVKKFINQSLFKPIGKRRECDRDILVEVRDELDKYDVVVSYFGGPWRFDLPMLNSRLIMYGEDPLPAKFHLDLYPVVKRNLRFKHRNLAIVSKFFGYDDKTQINPNDWVRAAMDGDRKAIQEIWLHNKADVILLEKLMPHLMPFVKMLRREA